MNRITLLYTHIVNRKRQNQNILKGTVKMKCKYYAVVEAHELNNSIELT